LLFLIATRRIICRRAIIRFDNVVLWGLSSSGLLLLECQLRLNFGKEHRCDERISGTRVIHHGRKLHV
jgi:hypothetical protein